MSSKIFYSFLFIGLTSLSACKFSNANASTKAKTNEVVQEDSAYDVILVAGQSNTYYGTGYDSTIDKPAKGIYQLGRTAPYNMKIIEAKEPLHHFNPKPERVGFALTFAKEYQKYFNDGRKILIIPNGMDNSGFEGDGWNKGNFLYNNTVERVNYVMDHYPKSKFVAILWHQGEKDVHYKLFQKSLDTLIVLFRKEIKGANNNTPFILGGMVPFWVEKSAPRQKQQQIIMDTKNRLPSIAYVDPYTPFKITKENNMQDTVHYNAVGQREMGKRYFEAYKSLLKK